MVTSDFTQASLWNFVRYNVVGGGDSALYGVEDAGYYLRNGFNNLNFVMLLALLGPALGLLQWRAPGVHWRSLDHSCCLHLHMSTWHRPTDLASYWLLWLPATLHWVVQAESWLRALWSRCCLWGCGRLRCRCCPTRRSASCTSHTPWCVAQSLGLMCG